MCWSSEPTLDRLAPALFADLNFEGTYEGHRWDETIIGLPLGGGISGLLDLLVGTVDYLEGLSVEDGERKKFFAYSSASYAGPVKLTEITLETCKDMKDTYGTALNRMGEAFTSNETAVLDTNDKNDFIAVVSYNDDESSQI